MKKFICVFIFTFIFMFINISGVEAKVATAEEEMKNFNLNTIDFKNDDLQTTCSYSNGEKINISKDKIQLISYNSSANNISVESNIFTSSSNRDLFSTDINYLKSLECPKKLYLYKIKVSSAVGGKTDTIADAYNDNAKNIKYIYSFDNDLEKTVLDRLNRKITIQNPLNEVYNIYADGIKNISYMNSNLSSQQVFLNTQKEALACDYELIVEKGDIGQPSVFSLYLYKNATLILKDGYSSLIPNLTNLNLCPLMHPESGDRLYLNDPFTRTMNNDFFTNLISSTRLPYLLYYSSSDECKKNNSGEECKVYKFKGVRIGDKVINGYNKSVCEEIGNNLIDQIQKIIVALQIIVPILVIILTAIDIGKIIVAGNIDEVLPKKKKIIIIRFVVLIIFLFAPVLSKLMIKLLNDTGIIKIDNIECLFRR